MMKKYFWILTILGWGLLLGSCGTKGNSQQKPAPTLIGVRTIEVERQIVTGMDDYPATVVPVNEIEIRPQVSGYITNIFVKDGQQVSKGQKLYEIDRSKYQAAYDQAQAQLKSAQANLEKVKKDVKRYEALNEKEAIAKQQLDYARTELLTAQSQVAAAQAQVKSAATDFEYSVLRAPFSGTIGISNVRLGAQVIPGQSLLNTLSSDDPVLVDFVINESEIRRYQKLLHSKSLPDSTFSLAFSGGEIYPYHGKITTMDRAVGRQSGTINLRVEFPNPERELVPGMTVHLQVLNQDIGNQVLIPFKAVSEQMGEYFVYVVNKDNTVHQQKVSLGTKVRGDIVIREGLKEGQEIVTEGIQKLRDGAKVNPELAINNSQTKP